MYSHQLSCSKVLMSNKCDSWCTLEETSPVLSMDKEHLTTQFAKVVLFLKQISTNFPSLSPGYPHVTAHSLKLSIKPLPFGSVCWSVVPHSKSLRVHFSIKTHCRFDPQCNWSMFLAYINVVVFPLSFPFSLSNQ